MDNTEFSSEEALTAKIITMSCLFAISMGVGLIPLLISLKFDWFSRKSDGEIRTNNRLVMGLLAFGGGVLFSTTFMHLLNEVDENIEILQEEGLMPEMPFYLAGLIMSAGFFMMYLVEELVHLYIHTRNKKNADKLSRTFSIRRYSNVIENRETENGKAVDHESAALADLQETPAEDSVMTALRGLLIVLALSIHELFEGLAVGLESSVANVWYMFMAVSAHKYLIAFCVGVELIAAGTKRWLSVVYIFTFSFMSALGIGVGILMVGGAGAAAAGIYSVVLQGLACGTLLYVVFFEVWQRDGTGLLQFVWSFLGFAIMTIIGLLVKIFFE
ncbi:unnamed protein product [Chilo suppressalis]|uniref:Uncharacterized protein n=1 Tax=Chilo suppressalis TaxID=168631 RepID=A0ABN8B1R3_CHISP|nr:hypothetical protein evm_007897 [Chilo suppressalis]CAH0400465.1 unnamed protein product [Chilo suppressalis]